MKLTQEQAEMVREIREKTERNIKQIEASIASQKGRGGVAYWVFRRKDASASYARRLGRKEYDFAGVPGIDAAVTSGSYRWAEEQAAKGVGGVELEAVPYLPAMEEALERFKGLRDTYKSL